MGWMPSASEYDLVRNVGCLEFEIEYSFLTLDFVHNLSSRLG